MSLDKARTVKPWLIDREGLARLVTDAVQRMDGRPATDENIEKLGRLATEAVRGHYVLGSTLQYQWLRDTEIYKILGARCEGVDEEGLPCFIMTTSLTDAQDETGYKNDNEY